LDNRAENPHQPTRVREEVMRRFKSAILIRSSMATSGDTGDSYSVNKSGSWLRIIGANLAPQTARAAATIRSFDPDQNWRPTRP
jgi:hypothetical protein